MGETYCSFFFQFAYAATGPFEEIKKSCDCLFSGTTIISGAIAERTNFYFYIIFSVFNTFVFCLPARWLWAETGFLKTMGVVDLAGSCGVNLVGGAGAFVGEKL